MKKIYLLTLLLFAVLMVNAQGDPCRARICLVDYKVHDDHVSNPSMTSIQAIHPDILITCTPGGYWPDGKTLPSLYTPLGIQVYSYIRADYEHADLNDNLARVTAIAAVGATGVFLDEVTNYPVGIQRDYIKAIYDSCHALNIKLIVNPGVYHFDSWLMSHSDYLMSDEGYNGVRAPSSSELEGPGRILVIADSIYSTGLDPATISLGARKQGFGYSYACDTFTEIPVWINTYLAQITQAIPTPIITLDGNTLHSDAPAGNQWYDAAGNPLPAATGHDFIPAASGSYYSIVTLQGCTSDTSNIVPFTFTGIDNIAPGSRIRFYPNPARDKVSIEMEQPGTSTIAVTIYDLSGRPVQSAIAYKQQAIDISKLAAGTYIIVAATQKERVKQKLIIIR